MNNLFKQQEVSRSRAQKLIFEHALLVPNFSREHPLFLPYALECFSMLKLLELLLLRYFFSARWSLRISSQPHRDHPSYMSVFPSFILLWRPPPWFS